MDTHEISSPCPIQENFDVFNCLAFMENRKFLEALKFGGGDGYLRYYLYNWRLSPTKPYLQDTDVGLVML